MSEQDKMTEQETEVTTSGEAPQEKKKQFYPCRAHPCYQILALH